MPETLEGGCFCGAVRYMVTGEPRIVSHCHCVHCRRVSGAAFVTWATYPASGFRFTKGEPARCESRPRILRSFCAGCGSPLLYQNLDEPDTLDITACTLDNAEVLTPQDHIWCSRKIPWVKLGDGLPQHEFKREPAAAPGPPPR